MNKLKHYIFSIALLVCFQLHSSAAAYYWVGNSGNWTDLWHWSNVSGGAGGAYASAPGSADTVYFTSASFTMTSQTVTLNTDVSVHTMDWTGSLFGPAIASSMSTDLYVYGSLKMAANTLSMLDSLIFKSNTAGNEIYFGNTLYPLAGHVCFDGIGGEWTFMNAPSSINTGNYSFFNGTVIFGFNSFYATAFNICEGSVTINANASNLYVKDLSLSSLSTAVVNITIGSFNVSRAINGGGKSFPKLTIAAPLFGPSGVTISGNPHIQDLNIASGLTTKIAAHDTLYISGSLILQGTNHVLSSDSMQTAYIHFTNANMLEYNMPDIKFYSIHISGPGTSKFGLRSPSPFKLIDYKISGFEIASHSYYWVNSTGSGKGNWETATNRWYANAAGTGSAYYTPPTWADSVFFTSNSFASSSDTVTLNSGTSTPKCAYLSIEGLTSTPMFYFTPGFISPIYIFGSLSITSQINTSSSGLFSFYMMGLGSDTNTIFIGTNMTNGLSILINPRIYIFSTYAAPSGPYKLMNNITQMNNFNLYNGYFSTNNYPISCANDFSISGTSSQIMALLGNSLIECNSYSAEPADSGVTLQTGATSYIKVRNGWFNGGGHSYNKVRLEFIGGGYTTRDMTGNNTINLFEIGDFSFTLNIKGNNTFGNFKAGNYNNLVFQAGSTQTVNGDLTHAVNLNPVFTYFTLKSSIAGTQANIIKPSGDVFLWLASIYDINVSGGASFKVVPQNNFDTANNSGWIPYMTLKGNGTNYWKNAASWTMGRVPTDTDRVVIAYTNTHYIDTIATCKELLAGPGNSGSNLRFANGSASLYKLSIADDLTIQSGSILGYDNLNAGKSISVGGDIRISNTGGLFMNQGGSKLTFNGTGSQFFAHTSGTAFPFIDSLFILTTDTFTFNKTIQARNYLKLSTTAINALDTLKLGTGASNIGSLNYTSGKIIGKFQRWFQAATVSNVLFPLGDSVINMHCRDAQISFTSAPASTGTLTASFVPQYSGTNGLPLTDGGSFAVINTAATGYWNIQPANGLSGGAFTLQLRGDGIPEIAAITTVRIVRRVQADSAWQLQGLHIPGTGTLSSPVANRLGLNSYGHFTIAGGADNALPVKLVSFKGSRISKTATLLQWSTASEQNSSHFEIERSFNGILFDKMSSVASHQNSTHTTAYQYTDGIDDRHMLYYRLKMIDLNGTYMYSDIITIGAATKMPAAGVYPNPAQDKATISNTTSIKKVSLYNAQGIMCFTAEPDATDFNINTGALTNGLYIVIIETNEGSQQLRLLIRN
jgi:hypothetical protein